MELKEGDYQEVQVYSIHYDVPEKIITDVTDTISKTWEIKIDEDSSIGLREDYKEILSDLLQDNVSTLSTLNLQILEDLCAEGYGDPNGSSDNNAVFVLEIKNKYCYNSLRTSITFGV